MQEKVLVIGGTGMLGLPVAKRLKADNFQVTILSSHPERARERLGDRFDIVGGDVTRPESLRKAMDGFELVYLNLSAKRDPVLYEKIEIGGSANTAQVAHELGIKRLITITGASSKGEERGVVFLDAKVRAERAIIDSGVPYTIMRASWFFESLPHFVRGNKLTILGKQPIPRAWLAASDYAAQVSAAYRTDEAANKCFYNLGPEKITIGEAVRRYRDAHHPDKKISTLPIPLVKFVAFFTRSRTTRNTARFFEYFDSQPEDVDASEADRMLGPNTTTLDDWLRSAR
ncbi:NAD(P)H-binding protein [candidate division GN15 bacterium]|nr:NAD(P)H-binding protein [candidate division GN15 bacterium]